MIIRQRTTFIDSFLLKVVFPYLETENHRSLMRLARMWNNDVITALGPSRQPQSEPVALGDLVGRLQHSLRSVSRWLQPQQALAPIAIANHRSTRRSRTYHKES